MWGSPTSIRTRILKRQAGCSAPDKRPRRTCSGPSPTIATSSARPASAAPRARQRAPGSSRRGSIWRPTTRSRSSRSSRLSSASSPTLSASSGTRPSSGSARRASFSNWSRLAPRRSAANAASTSSCPPPCRVSSAACCGRRKCRRTCSCSTTSGATASVPSPWRSARWRRRSGPACTTRRSCASPRRTPCVSTSPPSCGTTRHRWASFS
mmetsp:Transcript_13182/g.40960  ORF Transcript_13182/g.40960 Transcript_13182/m.40960 type:complete len:210 (+) Transcript_13182:522-1151(+)